MINVKGKMLRVAALSAAVMLTAAAAPVSQLTNSLVASAEYGTTDTSYTVVNSGNMTFYKYSDHAELYSVSSGTNSVTVPSTVDGVPVTAVARYGCQCASSLTSITLPDSIKTIGYYAFSMCSNLTSVKLPASLEVMEIHSFEYCKSLTSVEFPNKLVKIHGKCFESTPWLESQRSGSDLVIINGCLFDGSKASGAVTVPSSVKYVSSDAFAKNDNITSVKFPTGVTELCDDTFYLCKNLNSVELPAITRIGSLALGGCNSLRELKISGNLTEIADYAFMDTPSSVTITFYGSKSKWDSVKKASTNDSFLNSVNMVYDENHSNPDPDPDPDPVVTYPKIKRVEYNTKYHQFKISWSAVPNAQAYGIAYFAANKWRSYGSTLSPNTLSWTSPKLTPGKQYKVAVAAKVNGSWDKASAVSHSVAITVR